MGNTLSIFAQGGILGALIPLIGALIIFYLTVKVVFNFIGSQVSNLFRLYTQWETETLDALHPYTRSILENRCPELALIRTLRKQGQGEQVRNIVQSVIDTLETNETEPVKFAIIRELKGL